MSRKQRGYWTKENCAKAALQCKTRTEFKTLFSRAWSVSKQNGWLEDLYSHMVSNATPRGYWQNYNNCYKAAKQCITASEFGKRFHQAYRVALKEEWTKDYTWFVSGFELAAQRNAKWTYETCREESKKYKTRTAFRSGATGAYEKAWKKGWLDDFTWLNRGLDIYGAPDCVYKYEFREYNTVYIGRTVQKKDRHYAHIFCVDKDAVAKFAYEHNIPVPEMEIIADDITLEEGQNLEAEWIKHYIAIGYNILNKAKTGKNIGSLGSLGWGKWTYETCYEEAKKYKSRKEFQTKNVSAYTRALQYKWLDDYDWFLPAKTGQTKWTEKKCFEEAKKFIYIEDFRQNSKIAYEKAKKMNWLKQYDWLTIKTKPQKLKKTPTSVIIWTKERCYEEAKKYKSRTEFQYAKGASTVYKIAIKNGWIDDYEWMTPKTKPNGYWNNYERCYEEAKKYKSRKEFQYAKGASRAYKYSVLNGWIDSFTWMSSKRKKAGYWTKEQCALEYKNYSTRSEFRKKSPSAYAISQRNGWLDDFSNIK